MRKNERQKLIQKLLKEQVIRTQDDLVKGLQIFNVEATQATISRDIKEMHLVKVPATSGGYQYSMPVKDNHDLSGKLARLLKSTFVSVDTHENLVIFYTIPGNATAIGNLIHEMYKDELFTTMTNDDRILLIGRNNESVANVRESILEILK